jgi:hypothetical protein
MSGDDIRAATAGGPARPAALVAQGAAGNENLRFPLRLVSQRAFNLVQVFRLTPQRKLYEQLRTLHTGHYFKYPVTSIAIIATPSA